jgi:hypothetical protein
VIFWSCLAALSLATLSLACSIPLRPVVREAAGPAPVDVPGPATARA